MRHICRVVSPDTALCYLIISSRTRLPRRPLSNADGRSLIGMRSDRPYLHILFPAASTRNIIYKSAGGERRLSRLPSDRKSICAFHLRDFSPHSYFSRMSQLICLFKHRRGARGISQLKDSQSHLEKPTKRFKRRHHLLALTSIFWHFARKCQRLQASQQLGDGLEPSCQLNRWAGLSQCKRGGGCLGSLWPGRLPSGPRVETKQQTNYENRERPRSVL